MNDVIKHNDDVIKNNVIKHYDVVIKQHKPL